VRADPTWGIHPQQLASWLSEPATPAGGICEVHAIAKQRSGVVRPLEIHVKWVLPGTGVYCSQVLDHGNVIVRMVIFVDHGSSIARAGTPVCLRGDELDPPEEVVRPIIARFERIREGRR
jgi:hypothetical protein